MIGVLDATEFNAALQQIVTDPKRTILADDVSFELKSAQLDLRRDNLTGSHPTPQRWTVPSGQQRWLILIEALCLAGAVSTFGAITKRYPDNAEAHYGLGISLSRMCQACFPRQRKAC